MKQETFLALLNRTFSDLEKLTRSKGKEYANNEDHLANFHRLAKQLGLPPEAVAQVYLTKHLDSISCFIRSLVNGTEYTSSEPIEGRLDDAIHYLILLKALIHERENKI